MAKRRIANIAIVKAIEGSGLYIHRFSDEPRVLDTSNTTRWKPPLPPNLKFNCDETFDSKTKKSDVGMVLRDSKGTLIEGRGMKIPFVSSCYAEALAVREACLWALSIGAVVLKA
ncbi:unnamed protein product [Ilex paraguariensis]|uniref:RNase H type-1 domain-containing protein n=1 Tax=Ilex paraguariensis TaxID=185542 RepID=A0ABC8U6I7_9AQUA